MGFFSFYFENLWNFTVAWWWLFLPFFLLPVLEELWSYHIYSQHFLNNKYSFLLVKVPREQEKSPKLMENVISGIWTIYGETRNFMDFVSLGVKDLNISLEIVGIEGKVFFGVWVIDSKVDFLKSHIYSQYPDAEIEVTEDDYLSIVPDDIPDGDWDLWGMRWTLNKPDAYPIKTYTSFEDSVTGKMIDPLASYMEVLGDLGPGEVAIYQLILEPLHESQFLDDLQNEVEKILDRGKAREQFSLSNQLKKDFASFPQDTVSAMFKYPESKKSEASEDKRWSVLFLSPGEQEAIKEIEKSLAKRGFKAQYATIYMARKEVYNPSKRVGALLGTVNQFNSVDLNGFYIYRPYMSSTQYIFEESRKNYIKRRLLKITKKRQFHGVPYILNTEEIASLWHFPDAAVKAPHTPWIGSKSASAPNNLPLGR